VLLLDVTIPIKAVGKGRARTVRPRNMGGRVMTFTPDKTASFEARVAAEAHAARTRAELHDGALVLEVTIYKSVPKSYSAKKRAECIGQKVRPTGKPDCSNVAKAIEDAMNGIVYADDSQICELRVARYYATADSLRIMVQALA
jgi:Holliday junction resolvase RusA-like endonuclease